jgi:GNAT superfamily N-acetyltransferase
MFIRAAKLSDAQAMSLTLVASITELCTADHRNDPTIITQWIGNKTPTEIERWLKDQTGRYFVAEEAGQVIGVGAFRGDEVLLNYVAPFARFQGVSKAMLVRVEHEMRETHVDIGKLTTTETALRFYLAAGWLEQGKENPTLGVRSRPMTKALGFD